ncbi:MAG: hypothetical protein ACLF0P_13665 [Thermoanaerobaculia bacterium]
MLLVTGLTAFFGAEGTLWAEVVQYERAEAERLNRLAKRLGVSPERLEGTETGSEEALRSLLGVSEAEARDRAAARLEERLEAMEAEVADNPFRDEAEEVKDAYAPARVEAVLAVLAEVSSVKVARLSREARKALLVALRSELEAALELPARDDLPPGARGRAQAFRGRLNRLFARLRPILEAPHALSDERLSRTLAEVASAVDGEVRRPGPHSGPDSRPPDPPVVTH